jgi:hypothetical protein
MACDQKWTAEVIKEIKEWQSFLQTRAKKHEEYAHTLSVYDGSVAFTGILCGAVASMLQVITTSGKLSTDSNALHITSTVFTGITTLSSVCQKYYQFDKRRDRHWVASSQFANLSMDISTQLLLSEDLRTPLAEFVKDLASRRAMILQSEPLLP